MVLSVIRAAAAQAPSGHTFHVFIRGVEAGSEEVTVFGSPDGWALRGSGPAGRAAQSHDRILGNPGTTAPGSRSSSR